MALNTISLISYVQPAALIAVKSNNDETVFFIIDIIAIEANYLTLLKWCCGDKKRLKKGKKKVQKYLKRLLELV